MNKLLVILLMLISTQTFAGLTYQGTCHDDHLTVANSIFTDPNEFVGCNNGSLSCQLLTSTTTYNNSTGVLSLDYTVNGDSRSPRTYNLPFCETSTNPDPDPDPDPDPSEDPQTLKNPILDSISTNEMMLICTIAIIATLGFNRGSQGL